MASSGEAAATSEKRVRGRPFRKGVSGNPSGKRKNPLTPEEELARTIKRAHREALKDVREAFLELSGLARDTIEQAQLAEDCPWPVRLAAAKEVLDRAFGKPKEIVENQGHTSFVQIVQRALMMTAPPPPAHLGEIMTVEKFGALEADKTRAACPPDQGSVLGQAFVRTARRASTKLGLRRAEL